MEIDLYEDIARTFNNNTGKMINGAIDGLGLTLGTITSTGLKTDNLKQELTDYMILDYLKLNDNYPKNKVISEENHSHTISEGSCSNNNHSHVFYTPDKLKPLKNGDRVLVAQVSSDFIVIGRVSHA